MKKTVAHTSLHYFELSENWIHTQIKHLKGWERLVLTNETKNLQTVDWHPKIYERRRVLPVGFRELDSIAMKLIGYYPSFYHEVKKAKAKLIHAHFGPMGYLSMGIARKLQIPLVTTFYGYDASELPRQSPSWQENFKDLFRTGDCFLVEGPAMGEKLEALGCPSEKITIQRLGIELDAYPERASNARGEELKILMVGRFVEKKGFIYGLRAFQKFLETGGKGALTIVGDSNDSEGSQRIKRQMAEFVEQNQLQGKVNFKGLIPLQELKNEYPGHDVFLAPSIVAENGDDEGGLPVTIIEAAATGMALVGSKHCDIPEVIQHNKTGLLADEKKVEQLADHLNRLDRNSELRAEFGKEAARLIRKDYDAVKQGKKLAEIYDDLC